MNKKFQSWRRRDSHKQISLDHTPVTPPSLTVETQARWQGSPREACDVKSGTGTGFVPKSYIPLPALLHQYRLINSCITDAIGSTRASLNKTLEIIRDSVIEVNLKIYVNYTFKDTSFVILISLAVYFFPYPSLRPISLTPTTGCSECLCGGT